MTNDKIMETDAITGNSVEREMTDAEQEERNNFLTQLVAKQAIMKAEAEAKAAARAVILDRLGLTADEAALLLQ